nr:uncharacterized protein LOC101041786 [Saimiri boliviensis boliviensis]
MCTVSADRQLWLCAFFQRAFAVHDFVFGAHLLNDWGHCRIWGLQSCSSGSPDGGAHFVVRGALVRACTLTSPQQRRWGLGGHRGLRGKRALPVQGWGRERPRPPPLQ